MKKLFKGAASKLRAKISLSSSSSRSTHQSEGVPSISKEEVREQVHGGGAHEEEVHMKRR